MYISEFFLLFFKKKRFIYGHFYAFISTRQCSRTRVNVPFAWFKSYLSDRQQIVAVMKRYYIDHNAVWSTTRLRTRAITFHALHVTLGKYHQENTGLTFTVMLMILSSIFFAAR